MCVVVGLTGFLLALVSFAITHDRVVCNSQLVEWALGLSVVLPYSSTRTRTPLFCYKRDALSSSQKFFLPTKKVWNAVHAPSVFLFSLCKMTGEINGYKLFKRSLPLYFLKVISAVWTDIILYSWVCRLELVKKLLPMVTNLVHYITHISSLERDFFLYKMGLWTGTKRQKRARRCFYPTSVSFAFKLLPCPRPHDSISPASILTQRWRKTTRQNIIFSSIFLSFFKSFETKIFKWLAIFWLHFSARIFLVYY